MPCVSVAQRHDQKENRGIAIMQGPTTTLPVRGIAQNCLILNFATALLRITTFSTFASDNSAMAEWFVHEHRAIE
jgi:hypothetical protein